MNETIKAIKKGNHWEIQVVIVITVDGQVFSNLVVFGCAAAAENTMMAAESLGIGSYVTSTEFLLKSRIGRDLMEALGIPESHRHICVVALGYSDEVPPSKLRRRDVKLHNVIIFIPKGRTQNTLYFCTEAKPEYM